MKRSLLVVVIIVLLVGVLMWRHKLGATAKALRSEKAPALSLPQPLGPKPAYLKAAEDFLAAWKDGQNDKLYALLSTRLQKTITLADFAALAKEVQIRGAEPVAYTGTKEIAYVVMSVQAQQQEKQAEPIAGYSFLMRQESGGWRVALFLAEEKLTDQYLGLIVIPVAKGYVVSYHDKQGRTSHLNLQEP